jgi:hypothetical protein
MVNAKKTGESRPFLVDKKEMIRVYRLSLEKWLDEMESW